MGYHFRVQDNFVRIVELTPDLRRRIEATIEHLIGLLDEYDGDENLEPSLGYSPYNHLGPQSIDLENDSEINEPWLGAPEQHPRSHEFEVRGVVQPRSGRETRRPDGAQGIWGCHADNDDREVEDEHGGDINDEPEGEDWEEEPSLGFTEVINQASAARWGDGWDYERDEAEGLY